MVFSRGPGLDLVAGLEGAFQLCSLVYMHMPSPSARFFLHGFRYRPLMPLVRPLHELVFLIPIPLLHFADELLVIAFDLLQVIIGKFPYCCFNSPLNCFHFPLS